MPDQRFTVPSLGTDPASVISRMTELMEGRTAGLSRALPLPGLDRIVRRSLRAAPAQRIGFSRDPTRRP